MYELLWLIPALPLAGFAILAAAGSSLPSRFAAAIGVGTVGLSALLAAGMGAAFIASPPNGHTFTQTLWTWLPATGLESGIAFCLDPLALAMILVITTVGFLIHLYSVAYMRGEEGYHRFFAYMNLFMGSMLILVLADNLLFLYLGWEGVGLCSYLLIGFWYRDPANGYAARKAFVVTRVGDVALLLGIFLLASNLGTMQIRELLQQAPQEWVTGSVLATTAAFLLLGGAVGKSAQLPLQVWLPDAMAGPTPVSALIHAATMVTAGVYLVARMNILFGMAPAAQVAVAVIGAATLLLGGCSALVQRDIKRVLAYSTISQIGYMFLALGVGAWAAAIFHFMAHAFFKALLFLGAGAVMLSMNHERDLCKMGGLRKQLPLTFWTFLIGSASLSAVPLITAGFYTKDLILQQAWAAPAGGGLFWAAGLAGAFITSLYSFRVVFLVFFGEVKGEISRKTSPFVALPLVVLAALSLVGGFLETPRWLGSLSFLTDFLEVAKPFASAAFSVEFLLQLVASLVSLGGIYAAYLFYYKRPSLAEDVVPVRWIGAVNILKQLWSAGWGFDWLYNNLIVGPFLWFARVNKNDFLDFIAAGLAWSATASHRLLSYAQTGNVRWYAAVLSLGAVLMIALAVSR